MKFKIDENLPLEAANLLKAEHYDAETIFSENLSGSEDIEISKICKEENRILITLDLDFSDIRTYPPEEYPGFIVLRLKKQDKLSVLTILQQLIPALTKEKVEKRLWIVDESGIRIHESKE